MNVLVVDDHPIARRGLRQVLGAALDVAHVEDAATGTEALAAARALQPDLVTMDLDLPGTPRGAVLAAQLAGVSPASAVVVVTAFDRAAEVERCLAAGARGALLKDTCEEDLVSALRRVVAGEVVVSSGLAARTARHRDHAIRLTAREREVLDLLAEGCSNREIGDRLVVSLATVKDHVGTVMRKLGASSRLQAVVRASEEGLL